MATDNKASTHTAYAFSRQGKKFGRLLECGKGRLDTERNLVHVFMDRGPITGYTGYIVLAPVGTPTPKIEPPTVSDEDEGEDESND